MGIQIPKDVEKRSLPQNTFSYLKNCCLFQGPLNTQYSKYFNVGFKTKDPVMGGRAMAALAPSPFISNNVQGISSLWNSLLVPLKWETHIAGVGIVCC